MDRAAYLRLIRGEQRGPIAALLRFLLWVVSLGYELVVRVRNARYDRPGSKLVTRSDLPVVSIGNLTLGGTGKTPMVEWVARWYRDRGLRVTILSRGYGTTEGLNDEGLVLAENLPDVPHLQDRDRVALARIAAEELESQLLVLDDGFQHRSLGRNLDIVLLDALDPFGLGRLFPRGLLREPVSSLRRAQLVVLSRADLVETEVRARIRSQAEAAVGALPWVEARHAPLDLIDTELASEPLSALQGKRVLAFCGIGNPEGFRKTLSNLGVIPILFQSYPDHHNYSLADVEQLASLADSSQVDLALTTQKDLVKLRATQIGRVPVRALRIGLEVTAGRPLLESVLSQLLPDGETSTGS